MSDNLRRAESLFNRIMNQTQEATPSKTNATSSVSKPNGSPNGISEDPPVLPKQDPVKLSNETLELIPENHHILPYCWTIWHHSRSRKPKEIQEEGAQVVTTAPTEVNVDTYLQTTTELEFIDLLQNKIKHIGSLEQLWVVLSSIKKTYELTTGTEFLVFKAGINPVWEDPINAKGGRWVFRFSRKIYGDDKESIAKIRKRTSLIWERLMLKTMTGSIIPDSTNEEFQSLLSNDICGIVLSVRKDEDIISIWNSNLNFQSKKSEDKKKLTSFQARRIICDSILRIIRECDLISQGSDCIDTLDSGSNERVFGVSFEYRLHDENIPTSTNSKYNGHHHHHHHSGGHHGYNPHHQRRYRGNYNKNEQPTEEK